MLVIYSSFRVHCYDGSYFKTRFSLPKHGLVSNADVVVKFANPSDLFSSTY